jgi:hypothetical protein
MYLKRYEDAADALSKAIDRAPESKQPALRDLRRQCLLAESGYPAVANTSVPATTSQSEIVLWKSIENSHNTTDFQNYLGQYPNGGFVELARRHLAGANARRRKSRVRPTNHYCASIVDKIDIYVTITDKWAPKSRIERGWWT